MIESSGSLYFQEALFNQMKAPLQMRRDAINSIFLSGNTLLAKQRTQEIKKRINALINIDFPNCSLDPIHNGTIDCGEYVIEKVLVKTFETSYVPVNVYRLKNLSGRSPAVISAIGHWPEGKAHFENQILCANLCLNGYIVFTFDPQYQGERENRDDDFSDLDRDDYICVANHMKAALPQFLYGRQFMAHYLWDGMRVIDYICSRNDVDVDNIGGLGQSGGGTQISFLSALDERIKAVVAIQYLTSAEEDLHWNGVGDAEQAAFGLYLDGYDKADLGWMIAPRPLLINAALKDEIFPLEGVMRLKDELKRLYNFYGIAERLELCVSDSTHTVHRETREGCYYWMNKWIAKKEGFLPERDTKIFTRDELACGFFEHMKKDAVLLAIDEFRLIKSQWEKVDSGEKRLQLRNFFASVQRDNYDYYVIEQKRNDGVVEERFRIHTHKNFDIDCVLFSHPDKKETVVILDVDSRGLMPDEYLSAGKNVLMLYPFGVHYTNRESKKIRYDTQACVVQSLFAVGTDMVTVRVNEVLCALDYVKKVLPGASFHFRTTAGGGILALVAGLFEDDIVSIHTDGMLESFSSVIENRNTFINDSDIIVGFSKRFDISDLVETNFGKEVVVSNPVGAFGVPKSRGE